MMRSDDYKSTDYKYLFNSDFDNLLLLQFQLNVMGDTGILRQT
jgi:hypothetical protein